MPWQTIAWLIDPFGLNHAKESADRRSVIG